MSRAELLLQYKREKERKKALKAKRSANAASVHTKKKSSSLDNARNALQKRDANARIRSTSKPLVSSSKRVGRPNVAATALKTDSVGPNKKTRGALSLNSSKPATKRVGKPATKVMARSTPATKVASKVKVATKATVKSMKAKLATKPPAKTAKAATRRRPGAVAATKTTSSVGRKKVFKFVKIRVRGHNKQRWRDVNTKKAAPIKQLYKQLAASFGACVVLERVSGIASMRPEFYDHEDCSKLEHEAQYIVHNAESRADREKEMIRFEGASTIQRVWRGRVHRLYFGQAKTASVAIQSIVRRQRAIRDASSRRRSTLKLQTWVRKVQASRLFATQKSAAKLIQKGFRSWREEKSAVLLQSIVRGLFARSFVRKATAVTTLLQSLSRRKQPRHHFKRIRNAGIVIQRRWRSFQWYLYEQRCMGGAMAAQKIGRSWLVRRQMTRLAQFFKNSLLRMYAVAARRHRHECAKRIQGVCRARLDQLNLGASQFQKLYRGHVTRQHVRRCNESAIQIQAQIRGFCARLRLFREHQAATIVQSAVRKASEQRRYRLTRLAIINCQANMRMLLAMQSRWQTKHSAKVVHRFMRWQKTAAEAAFNRKVFVAKHYLDQRMQARQQIKDKLAASQQRKQDDLLGRIRRIEARAKAQGMVVRPGEGRRFLEVGMFCSPTTTPRTRRRTGRHVRSPPGTVSLSIEERLLMDENDVEKDDNLLSCCQTYLSQLQTVLSFPADGNMDELRIAYEIKSRAREHIEMLWGVVKRRSQRRDSLF